jgi:hypothetical protein
VGATEKSQESSWAAKRAILARVQLSRLVILLAWLGAALVACTRVESGKTPPGVSVGANGSGGEADGGSGPQSGAAGEGEGGSGLSSAGSPGSLELGIWPTFARQGQEPTDAAAVLASIAALSAGAAVLPIYERWDELSGATGSPRAVAWQRLDAMVAKAHAAFTIRKSSKKNYPTWTSHSNSAKHPAKSSKTSS